MLFICKLKSAINYSLCAPSVACGDSSPGGGASPKASPSGRGVSGADGEGLHTNYNLPYNLQNQIYIDNIHVRC